MSQLNIIVAVAEGRRLYAALETAMASAALGRPARVFLQGEAVALLRDPMTFAGDAARRAAGQPDLAWMIEEAMAMEIEIFACQSGMALVGLAANETVPHIKAGGLVSFLSAVDAADKLIVY